MSAKSHRIGPVVRPGDIVVVGLGAAAQTHLRVLERIADVIVVAGVDAAPSASAMFRDREIPVYTTVQDAAAHYSPSLVVVATPTATHAPMCREVIKWFPGAAVLLEKPAADNFAEAYQILHDLNASQSINIAYHMAFSPEVIWGADLSNVHINELGHPVAIVAMFADPYEAEIASAERRFGNSWIDSGINALSVIARFAEPVERTSLRSLGPDSWSTYEGRIRCRVGHEDIEALIVTSWHATAPSRTTRIKYRSGAELVLDHHGVAAYLLMHGGVREFFGSDGHIPRRESHYRALYDWFLVGGRPVMPAHRSLLLHDLLLRADGAP